ncbi:hypothetical protein MKX03_019754 [Papaver bracteatum]|nr:hypothetical protein MKX03_019754 [Papaver bracteatum]
MKPLKDFRINTNIVNSDFKYDEDEDVCRICRNPGESENPLKYPCTCSGSIKFVHQDCLLQWLNYSNARRCEICRYPFSFSPVYAENASRLSVAKFVFGYLMRLSLVLSVWLLLIVPITFWIWRLAFVRSFGEAQGLLILSRHISAAATLVEYCFEGFLLPASILSVFLGATFFRDYFRHLLGGQGAVRQDEDPVRFDDLVSMQLGPVFQLVKFAFTVLASNMKIIGAVIFLPFSMGRIILHIVQRFSSTSATGHDIVSRLSDTTILATGYMFIAPMVLFHLGIVAMVTYAKGEALNMGRLYVVAYIADSISSLVRQYTTIMRRLMSMVRPVFLLLVELGVFPLICGVVAGCLHF